MILVQNGGHVFKLTEIILGSWENRFVQTSFNGEKWHWSGRRVWEPGAGGREVWRKMGPNVSFSKFECKDFNFCA